MIKPDLQDVGANPTSGTVEPLISGADDDVPVEIWNDDNFGDESWHNDSCACFVIKSLQVDDRNYIKLWVDYKDPEMRDVPSSTRFFMAYHKDDEYECDIHHDENATLEDIFTAIAKIEKEGFGSFVNYSTKPIMEKFYTQLKASK